MMLNSKFIITGALVLNTSINFTNAFINNGGDTSFITGPSIPLIYTKLGHPIPSPANTVDAKSLNQEESPLSFYYTKYGHPIPDKAHIIQDSIPLTYTKYNHPIPDLTQFISDSVPLTYNEITLGTTKLIFSKPDLTPFTQHLDRIPLSYTEFGHPIPKIQHSSNIDNRIKELFYEALSGNNVVRGMPMKLMFQMIQA